VSYLRADIRVISACWYACHICVLIYVSYLRADICVISACWYTCHICVLETVSAK